MGYVKKFKNIVNKWIVPVEGYLPCDYIMEDITQGPVNKGSFGGARPKIGARSGGKRYKKINATKGSNSYILPSTNQSKAPWMILRDILFLAIELDEPTPPIDFLIQCCQFDDRKKFHYYLHETTSKNPISIKFVNNGKDGYRVTRKEGADALQLPLSAPTGNHDKSINPTEIARLRAENERLQNMVNGYGLDEDERKELDELRKFVYDLRDKWGPVNDAFLDFYQTLRAQL